MDIAKQVATWSKGAIKMTELTPEQKELAMNERYDLLDSIPDLRENLKPEYKDDETTEELPKGKDLLNETQPTTCFFCCNSRNIKGNSRRTTR